MKHLGYSGVSAAKSRATKMWIGTSESEAMVLSWKRLQCHLQVGNEFLPQVKTFKYLRGFLERA